MYTIAKAPIGNLQGQTGFGTLQGVIVCTRALEEDQFTPQMLDLGT